VQGQVMGGAGADTFIPGSEGEEFSGGDGLDTLNFRFAGAVAVALDGSRQNSGMAAGDSYSGIEVVIGSGRGADDILGATGAERLSGLDGADSLDGQAGNDTLIGGLGADVLTGGLGNDAFRFQRVAESGDSILDFHKVTGDKDQIQIQALGFGGGLTTGLLAVGAFQARADNVAQDGTDRFIFRTTDTTLWYDADGTGAAAAVMLADLQAGVSLVASDILIF
jgi:Ca2+-binding RTX toxin-like protein